jgi:predicted permease
MQLHVDLIAKEYEQAGMPAEEARLAARRRFGNVSLMKERGRDIRGAGILDDLRRDFLYALQIFRRTPVFATVIVLSLALGIGANTAMYSAIDAMFLRPIPVKNPHELVVFGWRSGPSDKAFSPPRGGVFSSSSSGRIRTVLGASFSGDMLQEFRAQGDSLSIVAGFADADVDATIDGASDEITAQLVTGNFYDVLGVSAVAGRLIALDDDWAGAIPVVVISHGFWRRKFALDPSAIGKQVVLNGVLPATIIGVTPSDFHRGQGLAPDFSIPLAFEPHLASGLLAPENWGLGIIGRMKPGMSPEQVGNNLQGIFQGFALEVAVNKAVDKPRLEVFSAAQGFDSDVVSLYIRPSFTRYRLLVVMGGAVAVLLLIVGLNVANLLIARAATRRYEIGVRLAMGASRRRLIRQLLTESVTLALIGGALGTLFAYSGKDLLRLFLQQDGPTVLDFRIDPRVLLFCAMVSLLTGILFGISPAFRATRMDVASAVKQGSRNIADARSGIGRILLVVQVAMSVVLLVGASLLLRTVGNLPSTDIGFNAENVLSFSVNVQELSSNRIQYERLIDEISAVPGVTAVTTSADPFLGQSLTSTTGRFHPAIEGAEPVRTETVRVLSVRPNFFEVFGIPVIRGRAFEKSDELNTPRVAIITESLARQFPGDPIGWRVELGMMSFDPAAQRKPSYFDIVGVVKNVGASEVGLRSALDGTVFLAGAPPQTLLRTFDVRTAGNPMNVVAPIREVLRRIDPNLRASEVSTERELARRKLAPTRYIAAAWTGFGGLALLLTSVGLYGLLSHSVARRTNEIGIRMALGARGFHVLRVVMSRIFILVFVGLASGIAVSVFINLLLRALVYGVPVDDAVGPSVAAATMLAVTAVAGYLPARRATRVDPTVALRHE